jgi:ketosteroid isomerase-like protein
MTLSDEEEIALIFYKIREARDNGDFETVASFYSSNSNYPYLGTSKGEIYYGREGMKDAHTLLYENEYISRESRPPQIFIRSNFAWSILFVSMSSEVDSNIWQGEMRVTHVLEKEHDGWKITHMHASAPEVGTDEGSIWPSIMGIEKQISEWVEIFDLDPKKFSKADGEKFKSYLMQALNILKDTEHQSMD